MAKEIHIKRFLVQAVAECAECDGKGTLNTKPQSAYFTPDFDYDGQIVYRCTKCRGTGEIKLTVDLADAIKSINQESNA